MIQKKLEVLYKPFDKATRVPPGTTLFSAAHWIGLPIDSTCGGRGTCGKCKVQVLEGGAEITIADRKQLRPSELEAGWRLSCQAKVYEDTTVTVPELLRVPKAATMGVNRLVLLDPNVRKVYVELTEPDLEDQRSDIERLRDALTAEGFDMKADLRVLRTLPALLRGAEFKVTAVLGGDQLIAVEAGDTREESYGVAFDLGTTTVVGTLMNLRTGMAEAVRSTLNGQAPFGADVISRISHGMQGDEAKAELREAIQRTMNTVLQELYESAGVARERVYETVVVGNATMLHLLLGIDATPISMMPFTPAFREPLYLPAREVGLDIHPGGYVQTLPVIGAYVGADIVAGVVATGLAREDKLRVFVDGGIEGVTLSDHVELQVIGGDIPPKGICGSGLVDTVAQLRLVGLLDAGGKMRSREEVPEHPLSDRLITIDGVRAFLLAENVYLTQRDVRELQFGKGSIATGIKVLMDVMGVTVADLAEVLLGGSFGSYLNPESAKIIGLVPAVDLDRILSVGNTAGEGAKMSLLSFRERQVAFELPDKIEYVELSGRSDFNDSFVSVLQFPELETLR